MYHSGSQNNTEHRLKLSVLDVGEVELHSLVSIEVWSKTYNVHKNSPVKRFSYSSVQIELDTRISTENSVSVLSI